MSQLRSLMAPLRRFLVKGNAADSRKLLARSQQRRFWRPALEGLEPRLMLAADDIITVGRVLSSWSAADIQNNRETITYTVYNDQESDAAGVLLTTKLQPGVAVNSKKVET